MPTHSDTGNECTRETWHYRCLWKTTFVSLKWSESKFMAQIHLCVYLILFVLSRTFKNHWNHWKITCREMYIKRKIRQTFARVISRQLAVVSVAEWAMNSNPLELCHWIKDHEDGNGWNLSTIVEYKHFFFAVESLAKKIWLISKEFLFLFYIWFGYICRLSSSLFASFYCLIR